MATAVEMSFLQRTRVTIGRRFPDRVVDRLDAAHDWLDCEGTGVDNWVRPWLATTINRVRFRESYADSTALRWIDPAAVDWLLMPRYLLPATRGTYVYGGPWDRRYSEAVVHYKGTSEGFDRATLVPFERYTLY